jgi:HK97 family phage portal protein
LGLFNGLGKLFTARQGSEVGGLHVLPFQNKRPFNPDTNQLALVKRYQSYVYACVNINATTCAETPLRLFTAKPTTKSKALFRTRKLSREQKAWVLKNPDVNIRYKINQAEDIEEVLEHPFIDLIVQVNRFMNGFDLAESLYSFLDLTGNMYWFVLRNPLGVPIEIWPLFPQFMKVIPDKDKFVGGYEYKPSLNTKTIFELEDIIHFKKFHPNNSFYGLGCLQAAVAAADLGTSMNAYEIETFRSSGLQDMALVLPAEAGEPTGDEMKRMQREWKKKYAGLKRRGQIPITTGGAKLEKISFSPKEMAFLKGRRASLNEVAAIFGVPMSLLTTEDVNRANAEAGERQHTKKAILPRLRRVEQRLNEQLMPMFDQRLFVAYDNPVAEDKDFRLKERESNLRTGYTTINEERQIDGKESVEYGEVPLMPMNIAPLGTVSEAAVIENGDSKHIDRCDCANINKAPRKLPPLGRPTNFVSREMVRIIRDIFDKQEKEVLAGIKKDAAVLNINQNIKGRADDFMAEWFPMSKWNAELDMATEPYIKFTMNAGGERAIASLASDIQYNSLNPLVFSALEKHRSQNIVSINSTTQKRLRELIAESMEGGMGATGISKQIREEFAQFSKHRAETIARTEAIWAFNEGAKQGYLQSQQVQRMEWVSSADERTCQFCPEMDGKIVSIVDDENFFNKGGEPFEGNRGGLIHFEYSDIGHPPLHPMCRCTVVPVIDNI